MAIELNAARYLAGARRQGVSFDSVLMFGRQHLNVYPGKLKQIFERNGLPTDALLKSLGEAEPPFYAEPLFRALGAREICSVDYSPYQQAEFIHDMNEPIPDSLKSRFEVVYDGGSLEHIFNLPTALKNCMEMVRPGGRLFFQTPANNCFGHAFYQCSPELFYRALSDENGFKVERMIAHPMGPYGRWHEVADPAKAGGRGELITLYPVWLIVQAQRIRETEVFKRTPQQSDYTTVWNDSDSAKKAAPVQAPATTTPRTSAWSRMKNRLPGAAHFFRALKRGWTFMRTQSFSNRRYFNPVDKP